MRIVRNVVADDPDGDVRGVLGGVPGGEKLADAGIEDLLQRDPGIEQVVVDPPERHSGHDWMTGGPVAALDQQDPLGLGCSRWTRKQEVGRRRVRHLFVENDECCLGAGCRVGLDTVQR